jgi:hypothetical protein
MHTPVTTYVVAHDDPQNLDRIPRWPNDGLSKSQLLFQSGEFEHNHFENPCGLQKKLTDLLGGWPSQDRLDNLPDQVKSFLVGMPWQTQEQEAKKCDDHVAAMDYVESLVSESSTNHNAIPMSLVPTAKQKKKAAKLIKKVHLKSALSKSRARFPSLEHIMLCLAKQRQDSDKNLTLLFGDVSRVRGLALTCGPMILAPPTSNTANYVDSVFNGGGTNQTQSSRGKEKTDGLKRTVRVCGWCEKKQTDECELLKCTACQQSYFCNKNCFTNAWPIHRPECRRSAGKSVSTKHLRVAKEAVAKRAKEKDDKMQAQAEAELAVHAQRYQMYRDGTIVMAFPRFGIDGQLCTMDLDECGFFELSMTANIVGLKPANKARDYSKMESPQYTHAQGNKIVLIMDLPGLESEKIGVELHWGVHFSNPSNHASVIVFMTNLYPCADYEGTNDGFSLQAIAIVDKIVAPNTKKNEIKWTLVPEPNSGQTVLHPMHTVLSFHDLHKWLISAHSQAVIDTKGFYYGTKFASPNMGEPPLNFQETEMFNNSMKVS